MFLMLKVNAKIVSFFSPHIFLMSNLTLVYLNKIFSYDFLINWFSQYHLRSNWVRTCSPVLMSYT